MNLHQRVGEIQLPEDVPLSVLRFKGTFSADNAMQWISSCINDVPTQAGESEELVKMYFKSTFIDTIIVVEVSPGLLEVKSDNLSAITIIKDHVSSEASTRKI